VPVILTSIFSVIIIFTTVLSMIKVLNIAYKRKEISILKYRVLAISFVMAGMILALILPFGYQKMFEIFL
jgi:hypothetical protein